MFFKMFLRGLWIGLLSSLTMPVTMGSYAVKVKSPAMFIFSLTCNLYTCAACVVIWVRMGWVAAAISYGIVSVVGILAMLIDFEKLMKYNIERGFELAKKFG
jgi:hypothetical protein